MIKPHTARLPEQPIGPSERRIIESARHALDRLAPDELDSCLEVAIESCDMASARMFAREKDRRQAELNAALAARYGSKESAA